MNIYDYVWPCMTQLDPFLHCFVPQTDNKPKKEESQKIEDNTKNNNDP